MSSEKIAMDPPAYRHDTLDSTASDEAIPVEKGDVAGLLTERLQAWKHMVGYLEAYVSQTESVHKHLAKEYEKVLKTVADPLRETHHFDQNVGGISSFFDNLRTNTQTIATTHTETEKALKNTVMPVLERLHQEIKDKSKQLRSMVDKSSKAVIKARSNTQSHIDLLSQQASTFDGSGGGERALITKPKPESDPYILQRGVMHRLHKQVLEENANRQDLLAGQNMMVQFEAHVVQTVQQAMGTFYQLLAGQLDKQKACYGDIVGVAQRLPPDFEWNGFLSRYADVIINPNTPTRSVESISFANQGHRSTKPFVEGVLNRKGKIIKSYNSNYYVVTPSKYLHQFKDNDNYSRDPDPEMSLYLPDCTLGPLSKAPEGKFTISGKDVGSTLGFGKHEFAFKASSHDEGAKWHAAISNCMAKESTTPTSAVAASPGGLPPYSRHNTQESGTTQGVQNLSLDTSAAGIGETVASPAAMSPKKK
ncbi:hypothetical protein RUND412_003555 [Rhizina undulata]